MAKKAAPTFKGTRDISGDDMRWRLEVMETVRRVFVLFGFEPLETPVIERKETLFGKYGEEAENLLFLLAEPHKDGGLRYDHTVPLARFAASNWNELPKPYKRYAIGPVFRAENPQSGRFRQFYQCDFDTLGSDSLAVDAEIVAINNTVLTELGFTDQFAVQVNDRRLLNAMVREIGFTDPAHIVRILRAWDKLDKNSPEEVLDYLVKEMAEFGVTRRQLEQKYVPLTSDLLESQKEPASKILARLRKRFADQATLDAIDLVEQLNLQVQSLGVPQDHYQFNPLLARGLGYYTGPIFETVVKQAGIGSITGGGRFDNLIQQMGGPSVPASGSSFGLDRLLVVMEQLGLRPQSSQTTQVFVSIFDSSDTDLTAKTLAVASSLREAGIPTEVYSGAKARLGKQIELAAKKQIPLLLILGPDELSQGQATIRDLRTRTDSKVNLDEVVSKVTFLTLA